MMFDLLLGYPNRHTPVDVHEVEIPLPVLPPALSGMRIAVLSDLHYARFVQEEFTQRLVDLTNAQKADLILLPGDIVNRMPKRFEPCGQILAQLRAPLGVFACLGNHDWYTGTRRLVQELGLLGITVLVNSHRRLSHNGAEFILAGVDDFGRGLPDIDKTLGGTDGSLPVLLMSHNPDQAEAMDGRYRVDLMISGHTHGGQVCPFGRAIVARVEHRKYLRGLARGPHCLVYTSRGVGMVGVPVRLDSRPEIPVLRLVAADNAAEKVSARTSP